MLIDRVKIDYMTMSAVTTERLSDEIGLLRAAMFPGVVGIDVAKDIDRGIAALNGCSRLIVDLRGNIGGGIGGMRLMSYLTRYRRKLVESQAAERNRFALDDALNDLTSLDEQQGRIVELRFLGGLATEEIAAVLGISSSTVQRDWNVAKAWLIRQLRKGNRGDTRAVAKN